MIDPAELAGIPLADLVAAFNREGFTGTLAVFADDVQRFFLFVEGELRAARSSAEEEKLGSWLVRTEHISNECKSEQLRQLPGSGALSFGHLLVGAGMLEQTTLDAQLQELALEIIRQAAAQSDPELGFYEGYDGPMPWDTMPDTPTSQLVLDIARRFPNERRKREALGPFDQVVCTTKKLDDLYLEFSLQPTEAFLLSRLDGSQTIRDVVTATGLPEETAVTVLYALQTAGLVRRSAAGERAETTTGGPPERMPSRPGSSRQAQGVESAPRLTEEERREREEITEMARAALAMDHYGALGITPDADADTIRRAWASWQNRFHARRARLPHLRDLGEELETIYQRAESAYEVLSTRELRSRYDRIRQSAAADEAAARAKQQQQQEAARRELVAANVRRAEELARHGELYLATELLESAAEILPEAETYLKLGRLLAINPRLRRRALEAYRKAVDLDQGCVHAWIEMAGIWQQRGQVERQRKALERALAAEPYNEHAQELYRKAFGKDQLRNVLHRLEY